MKGCIGSLLRKCPAVSAYEMKTVWFRILDTSALHRHAAFIILETPSLSHTSSAKFSPVTFKIKKNQNNNLQGKYYLRRFLKSSKKIENKHLDHTEIHSHVLDLLIGSIVISSHKK